MRIDLLVLARWIITVDHDNKILPAHAVAIDKGIIVNILPHNEALRQYQATQIVELPDHALCPGLINAHTHAAMALLKGLADDLPLMDWLQNHIWPIEAQLAREAFVYQGTQLAIAEMIRSGTTCFNDMYFFTQSAYAAVHESGIRANLGLILIDFPTAYAPDLAGYIQKAHELMHIIEPDPLVTASIAPHAPYTVSDESLQALQQVAQHYGLRTHMHIHETAIEVQQAMEQTGIRPLQRLEQLGIVNEQLMAVHMTQLTEDDISLLAARHSHVIHCPESNLKLASGFCPVQRLLDAGVNVALGTDSNASNNDLDMVGEMHTAALLAKMVAHDASAVSAQQALRMATINGAKALGLHDKIGSLEIGKQADMIAIDFSVLEAKPLYDPISHLVYCTNRQQITHNWVAGKALMIDRHLLTLNEQTLHRNAEHWQDLIAKRDHV